MYDAFVYADPCDGKRVWEANHEPDNRGQDYSHHLYDNFGFFSMG
jgi:hypothetical protein